MNHFKFLNTYIFRSTDVPIEKKFKANLYCAYQKYFLKNLYLLNRTFAEETSLLHMNASCIRFGCIRSDDTLDLSSMEGLRCCAL